MYENIDAGDLIALVATQGKKTFDKEGSFNYYWAYQTLGNASVGVVTVWHMPWSDLIVQIKMFRQAATVADNAAEVAVRGKHIRFYADWLRCYVLRDGDHFPDGKLPTFRSPLAELEAKDGKPSIRRVCPKAIKRGVKRGQHMLIRLSEDFGETGHELTAGEELTLRNMERFATMMIASGRMGQELTIDAAKKYYRVEVALEDGMKKGKMMSRLDWDKKAPFGTSFDFKAGEFKVNTNPSQSQKVKTKSGKRFVFADIFDELRTSALKESVDGWGEIVTSFKQEIPAELQQKAIATMAAKPKVTGLIEVMMKAYRTLQNTKNNELSVAKRLFSGPENKDMLRAHEDVLRNLDKKAFGAITNTVRTAMKDLTPEERVLVALGVTLKNMGKDATRPSSFVGIILEEEFMAFITSLNGEERQETLDRLVNADDLTDGMEVEFRDNHQVKGRAFVDGNLPDGKYVIRQEGKQKFAARSIREMVLSRIPEETPAEICFQTTGVLKGRMNADLLVRKLRMAKQIVLVPHAPAGVLCAQEVHDAVVADGEIVAHFDNEVGNKVNSAVNEFYAYKAGNLMFHRVNEYKNEAGLTMVNVFVALKDVAKTSAPKLRKAGVRMSEELVKAEAKKGQGVKSGSSRADALFGSGNNAARFGESKRDPFTASRKPAAEKEVKNASDAVWGQFAGVESDF